MNRFFLSKSNDPHLNLSFEHYLFSTVKPDDLVFYLWNNSETVVIGKFQNPWSECNVEKMNADGIKLMRRYSGGGAVFQDAGNLCFTLISGSCHDIDEQKNKNNSFIISTLKSLSIQAYSSGRNDILVDGRKISGAAFQIHHGSLMHHGTLLVNTDLDKLQLYLNPSKEKLRTKGIASVRSRVANLNEFNSSVTVEILIDALKESFENHFGKIESYKCLDESALNENVFVKEEFERLISWDWLYGKTPEFTDSYKNHFSWGAIELLVDVHHGVIETIVVYTDTLNITLVGALEKILRGIQFRKDSIVNAIGNHAKSVDDDETKRQLLDVATMFEDE